MNMRDSSGYALTGASPAALAHFERAQHAFQSWRGTPMQEADAAVMQAPGFVMAQVLRAYILVCGRESRNLAKARAALAAIDGGAMSERERAHLRIVDALCRSQLDRGLALLDAWLAAQPTDILALQVAHAFDYLLGDTALLRDRIARSLPDWSPSQPGYAAAITMHAFGLAENHDGARAVDVCEQALSLDPGSPRAHHVMAHVFENTERMQSGLSWLDTHLMDWSEGAPVSNHLWWHRALFYLQSGRQAQALRVYDAQLAPAVRCSEAICDLVDASSLLWRMYLAGAQLGVRARDLAESWLSHLEDGFCSFNDLHAVMALAMAARWDAVAVLATTQRRRAADGDSYAMTTRTVGMPACQAVVAYAQGRYEGAVLALRDLPPLAYVIGGSGAQRSVLTLTLKAARSRLDGRRGRMSWRVAPVML